MRAELAQAKRQNARLMRRLEHAEAIIVFFDRYNQDHHHAGIGLMTPDQVHYGQADKVYAARQITLDGAFSKNPERFVRKEPEPPDVA